MRKTVFIVSQSLGGGGAERMASNLSLEFAKKADFETYLVLFDGSNQTYPGGVQIIDMHLGPCSGKINKIKTFFKRIVALRTLKKRYKVSVCISLLSIPNLVNILSRVDEYTIVSVRNLISKSARSKFEKFIVKYCSRKADKTVSLSELVKLDLVDNFSIPENKIITIYNPCDANKLLELSQDSQCSIPSYPYVVTMGRLMRQKGQWHLINAFKRVHEKNPDLHLVILGQGELKESLERLVDDCGLRGFVHLLGYVVSPHLIVKSAKAFIFPSLFEGLGNVLLEAMACEVPVISMDCPAGPKEVLSNVTNSNQLKTFVEDICYAEYGVLVPPFNASDMPFEQSRDLSSQEYLLADAILSISGDNGLNQHYRKQSALRASNFSPEKIMKQWYSLFE